jgi:hypothetical protein
MAQKIQPYTIQIHRGQHIGAAVMLAIATLRLSWSLTNIDRY